MCHTVDIPALPTLAWTRQLNHGWLADNCRPDKEPLGDYEGFLPQATALPLETGDCLELGYVAEVHQAGTGGDHTFLSCSFSGFFFQFKFGSCSSQAMSLLDQTKGK